MTNSATPKTRTFTPAKTVEVGMGVVVGSRLAHYHSRPELSGKVLPVVGVTTYPSGRFDSIVGITLEGLPETCTSPDTLIGVEV